MKNFWQNIYMEKMKKDLYSSESKKEIPKTEPILVLAPMADVTDAAFRRIIAKYGKPDVFWTEFISADGLAVAPPEGQERLREALKFSDIEHPIVAQLFGSNPVNMSIAAKIVQDYGFDGVDINMGCPDRSVEKQKAGAAMIKDRQNAAAIIAAAKKGANKIPVSIKIRLGYNTDEMDDWLKFLLEQEPAVITIHARTRKEMSKVPAKWNRIADAIRIRDEFEAQRSNDVNESQNADVKNNNLSILNKAQKEITPPKTLIFGNGDIMSVKEANERHNETGCDGVMIGRGIFGKPWFFNHDEVWHNPDYNFGPDIKTRLKILIEHTKLFDEHIKYKNFAVMKKHFKAYVEGFDGAKELRMKLMETENASEVESEIMDYLKISDNKNFML